MGAGREDDDDDEGEEATTLRHRVRLHEIERKR